MTTDRYQRYHASHERQIDDICVQYLSALLPWLQAGHPPAADSRDNGWLTGVADTLLLLGVAPELLGDEPSPLQYIAWHALRRPGVADRMMSSEQPVELLDGLLDKWTAYRLGDSETISSSEAAEFLGLANANAATSQLRRWAVPTAPRHAGQGRESRYYRADVQAAKDARAGRGARTDLHHTVDGPHQREGYRFGRLLALYEAAAVAAGERDRYDQLYRRTLGGSALAGAWMADGARWVSRAGAELARQAAELAPVLTELPQHLTQQQRGDLLIGYSAGRSAVCMSGS